MILLDITPRELDMIRRLSDGKMTHFLTVVNDKGWELARILLPAMTA